MTPDGRRDAGRLDQHLNRLAILEANTGISLPVPIMLPHVSVTNRSPMIGACTVSHDWTDCGIAFRQRRSLLFTGEVPKVSNLPSRQWLVHHSYLV